MSLGEKGNYSLKYFHSSSRLVFLTEFSLSNTKFTILAVFHHNVNFRYLGFQSVFVDMISLCTSLTRGHHANNGSEWKKLSLLRFDCCLSSVGMCLLWRSCEYNKCASRQVFVKSFRSFEGHKVVSSVHFEGIFTLH